MGHIPPDIPEDPLDFGRLRFETNRIWPPPIVLREDEALVKVCPICESSLKQKRILGIFPVRTKRCINEECPNYYGLSERVDDSFKPWYEEFKE